MKIRFKNCVWRKIRENKIYTFFFYTSSFGFSRPPTKISWCFMALKHAVTTVEIRNKNCFYKTKNMFSLSRKYNADMYQL